MGKKFFNKSKRKIQFGSGNVVEPNAAIELDDETLKLRSQAIEQLLESGDIIEGSKDKEAEKKEKEEEKEAEKKEKEEEKEAKAKAEAEKKANQEK